MRIVIVMMREWGRINNRRRVSGSKDKEKNSSS
jgi:hypothetical protein